MRFSIRDLLWATLVVAMGLGWWRDYRQTHSVFKKIEGNSGTIQKGSAPIRRISPRLLRFLEGEPPVEP